VSQNVQLSIANLNFIFQVIAADEGGGQGRSNESLLAGAMAMALAHVNRQQAAAPAGSKVNHFKAKINNQTHSIC
jgi:hypothetical protein